MKIAKSGDELMAELEALCGPAQQFQPTVTYIRSGDCIEFVARPGRYRAERLDELVTVYLSEETGEVVGSLIKGVRALFRQLAERLPGFRISVDDGRIRLEHLFLAHLWSGPVTDQVIQRTYTKLAEVAEETKAEADLCLT